MLTRLSTFFGRSSWASPDKLHRMDEALWGAGGPRLLDAADALGGRPEDRGGGNSAMELSHGGGGNSGDGGATAPPGCHFGLALTAGGDCGAANFDPSVELEAGREEGAEFPGN